MRATHRRAAALLTPAILVTALVPTAARAGSAPPPPEYRADCRTSVEGSRAVAYCHNPYPGIDRVRLHVECARWWDIDMDGAPVDVRPADTVRLTDRCWKEIRTVWVSHEWRV
ncbi:hypothetical protein GCM10020367_13410 [Streptomyces sannanensis]|uniref:Secreted protein n=1 Tax=Streptomyces sannanensis TaxID=285536 RepID=A0ABP6S763_9ACTN